MKWWVFALVLSASARADEYPDLGCEDSSVGAACLTADGTAGTCVRQTSRVVGADGVSRLVLEFVCAPAVSAEQKPALPWLGLGLAFLALCAALALPRAPAGGVREPA